MESSAAAKVLQCIERISHKKFVIHGSSKRSSVLIPRRPPPSARHKTYRQKAVYATSVVEVAVLYAVISGDPRWKHSRKEGFRVSVPEEGFRLREGYIHVCLRKDFTGGGLLTSFAKRPVRPVRVIKVDPDVLMQLYETKRLNFEPDEDA